MSTTQLGQSLNAIHAFLMLIIIFTYISGFYNTTTLQMLIIMADMAAISDNCLLAV
jgi:hypothetical protein